MKHHRKHSSKKSRGITCHNCLPVCQWQSKACAWECDFCHDAAMYGQFSLGIVRQGWFRSFAVDFIYNIYSSSELQSTTKPRKRRLHMPPHHTHGTQTHKIKPISNPALYFPETFNWNWLKNNKIIDKTSMREKWKKNEEICANKQEHHERRRPA